ncbi:MAG TPA: bifunctional phosphopantothenoylcysteine decarboxylase/phosphopantothenate--cysteine ligase CoaBC [Armatimonadota bacterium]|jgi:phosphopantothenoylcysteine decarboxylase/phosphopantothenate--cysteine ligase
MNGKTIILGVTGGVAAYKAAEICSRLIKAGACVNVVMTEHAAQFVGPATFRALTGQQVLTGLWDEPKEYEITHIALPDKADAFLVAPATANIIGKVASGIADDMLSTMIMATNAPVIFAPAMNNKMWENPIVQSNVERLRSLGYEFVDPGIGRLACGVEAVGRLAETDEIICAVEDSLRAEQDLAGMNIMVTAGPTQEPIDPVRFIANRSSGKMGYAVARDAARRGARVVLVSGPTSLAIPHGVEFIGVRTAAEMHDAVLKYLPEMNVVIGAAAVADYRPKAAGESKIKKSDFGLVIELEPTTDIMAELGHLKGSCILVGFAAETENLLAYAKKKRESKHLDIIVANDVSKPGIGFGSDENQVTIIGADGSTWESPRTSKKEIAERILDRVKDLYRQ